MSNPRYDMLKEKNLCVCCGKVPPLEGKTRCQACTDASNEKRRKRRAEASLDERRYINQIRMEKAYKRRIERFERGVCTECGKVKPNPGKRMCPACWAKQLKYKKQK